MIAETLTLSSCVTGPAADVTGAFNVTRAVWPVMRERNYGRIVQTTSGTGLFGNFGQANYGAAKAGVAGASVRAIAARVSASISKPSVRFTS